MDGSTPSLRDREKFLMSLILDKHKLLKAKSAEKELSQRALQLGITDETSREFAVVIIRSEETDKAFSGLNDLLPLAESVFAKKYRCAGFCTCGKLVCLISGTLDGARAQLSYLASEAVQRMERVAHVRCSAGISNVRGSILQVDRAYDEAVFILNYLPDRSGGVYFTDDIVSSAELEHSRLGHIVSTVEGLLKVGEKSRLREYLEEVLPDEKPRGAAGMNYDMLSLQLNYCIHKAVYDLSDSPEADRFLAGQMVETRAVLSKEELLRAGMEAKDIITNQRKQNSELLCDRAMHIIETEYGDETLSLVNISERLHVSASYMSAILKKYKDDTFVNLLTAKRMTAAREYLMCTSMKIMEIAKRCGYSDQHYFSYCFKKYYGTSPNKVRRSAEFSSLYAEDAAEWAD